ncbi:DNA-directed RNA polymerase I subunit RPA34 [Paroedura picta]|uniref:DNA-directed RNA polymerase I subunit RPA34 n=1 Tax=Paroedura picta TaxID=143630 RepID=UPI00405680F7
MDAPREAGSGGGGARGEAHVGMEARRDPLRFQHPPDFSTSPFCPGPPFSPETLQDPSKELWLIRAPADFSPQSLEGRSLPLVGLQTLKASQPSGTEKIFCIQKALEHQGGARLLLPSGSGDCLACSPPFDGSLSICERYGDPSGNRPLLPVAARLAPRIPAGLKQRFVPFGSDPERALLPRAGEEPPRKKRKKKKHRLQEEGSEAQLPLFGMPLGSATGAGETEARGQSKMDGAPPLASDSQPGSAADAQNGLPSAVPEDLAPPSKKKKKQKKRKEDQEVKEEVGREAEIEQRHQDGAAPQVSSSAVPEEMAPSSKKKKKKRKEDREVKEEVGGKAEEATHHCKEEGAARPANSCFSPGAWPNSTALAEATGASSKKQKKKKETRGEAEATGPHQADEATSWALSPPPNPAATAQDSLLSGPMEDPAPTSKKKKKKRKREMGGEAEAAHPHGEDGAAQWGTGSPPNSEPVAQDSLLSGRVEDPSPSSKKQKKRKVGQAVKEEEEAGVETEAVCQPSNSPICGEAENPAPVSKKKKKKRKAEAEGLPDLNSRLAGSSELFSSQEDTTGVLWDFHGLGSTPEGGLLLAEESLGAANSSHKAKNRKKAKEKPEEAAQGLVGWLVPQGVEGRAERGTPLGGGGGGGQEEGPGGEGLSRKHKKKEHRRRQAGLEREAGTSQEPGSS